MKTTILYLSGSGRKVEEFISDRRDDFPNIGILLSYWELQNQGRAIKRLKDHIEREMKHESES